MGVEPGMLLLAGDRHADIGGRADRLHDADGISGLFEHGCLLNMQLDAREDISAVFEHRLIITQLRIADRSSS